MAKIRRNHEEDSNPHTGFPQAHALDHLTITCINAMQPFIELNLLGGPEAFAETQSRIHKLSLTFFY